MNANRFEGIELEIRRQMPTGGASMPTAAVITAEPMMTAAVEAGAKASVIASVKAEPGPGRRSG
jgi:hypothetical protein